MTEQEWAWLIRSARAAAGIYNRRIRIVAGLNSPRTRRATGRKWHYVWLIPTEVDQ